MSRFVSIWRHCEAPLGSKLCQSNLLLGNSVLYLLDMNINMTSVLVSSWCVLHKLRNFTVVVCFIHSLIHSIFSYISFTRTYISFIQSYWKNKCMERRINEWMNECMYEYIGRIPDILIVFHYYYPGFVFIPWRI